MQVAVLCGGLGSRLRPITDAVPKPMVPVADRPFLEHLLEQMAEQGHRRFLLMTGYLGEQVEEYFGDGSSRGWEVSYSAGPASWDTGRRLVEAAHLLEPDFLLLYSDNWADVDTTSLLERHRATGRAVTATLVEREGGNVRYRAEVDLEAYVPTREGQGLDHVEIGYMAVARDRMLAYLRSLPDSPDVGFSSVLASLADAGDLGGHALTGRYLSVSDPARLEVTREHFSGKRILLIDRDGTINRKAAPGEYVATREQFEFIPETVAAMSGLADDGFRFIVITNQAGIALGTVDEGEVEAIHREMVDRLATEGIEVLDVYLSPDRWDSGSTTRKPAPGLFHAASTDHRFRLDRVLYVGDDERDCQAAANAGCGMVFLDDGGSSADLPVNRRHHSVHPNLLEAVPVIRRHYGIGEGR